MKTLFTIIITFLLTLGLSFLLFSAKEEKKVATPQSTRPIVSTKKAITFQHDSTINENPTHTQISKPKTEKKQRRTNPKPNETNIAEQLETIEHLIEIKKASEAKIYHFEKQLIDLEKNKNVFNKRKREEKIIMTKQFLEEARISLQQINVRINQHMQEKNK